VNNRLGSRYSLPRGRDKLQAVLDQILFERRLGHTESWAEQMIQRMTPEERRERGRVFSKEDFARADFKEAMTRNPVKGLLSVPAKWRAGKHIMGDERRMGAGGSTGSGRPLPSLPPPLGAPPPLPHGSSLESSLATLVQVFYATDRLRVSDITGGVKYGKQRSLNGNLYYGRCEVSIPKCHRVGELETPSILRLEFRPDPKKHVLLSETYNLEESDFFKKLKYSVAKSSSKDAFVFVHGYNVSFEDAARRTGQIAYDLDFVGAPIFYSWPSNGKTADYLKDETNITWSTPHFQRFLGLLAQKSGAKRIHIIAHSMGNRAVCDALKALSSNPASQLKFKHLVLAAPDIDAGTFQELAATLQRLAGRVTLYESSQDKAIQASRKIHGNPRAGEPLLVVRGMDTIDASAIDTDFLGHSYFSDNWPLLSDIHSILFKDEPPSGRFGLVAIEHEDGKYYAFRR
jgi:esterase/lipase superfamily enzyme